MSFEILAETEIAEISSPAVVGSLVPFLLENIPELTEVSNKYTSETYRQSYNDYWKYDRTVYLSYDGLPFGMRLTGHHDTRVNAENTQVIWVNCCTIDAEAETGANASTIFEFSTGQQTVSGVTYRTVTCCIIKVDGNYIIRLGNNAFYLGYLTSAIAGKMFVFYDLAYLCADTAALPANYSAYGRAWVIDKGNYYTAYLGFISPSTEDRPVYTAILCPIYSSLYGCCAEPLVIPGVYRFYGSTNPGYDGIVEAAGVEVLQVNSVPVVVARPKV